MKKATILFDELLDGFVYTVKSWLHLDLADNTIRYATIIAASSAFLFDKLFAKENAGEEITQAAGESLGRDYDAKSLSNMATKIRLAMSGSDFEMGHSPLRDYLRWIGDAEPDALRGYQDDVGKLVLLTIEEMTNLILAENDVHEAPMHVAEIFFLTITDRYALTYLDLFGKQRFSTFQSSAYFFSVQEQMEQIRSQILD